MPECDLALERVGVLVEAFRRNEARYKSAAYAEVEARKDFIDKFWTALGWDVNHDQQTNPYEQEVKVERGVPVGDSQRRADYAFYLAPNFHAVRFFVEAKKPSVEIGTKENYFQLIRYGWNSETPFAVITDFEQFHVLDCRYKPDLPTALNRCIAKYHYTDYINRDKFLQIYCLFSREAVASGSLEKRARELPKPRGKAVQRGLFAGGFQSIDESFLAELDEYRIALARTFKNQQPALDSETLTELAQRTLDRLVFIRFLEDKGIEPQRLVERFGDKGTAWEDFIAASRRLDKIYNGIVFRHHAILDAETFRVDDNPFARICESLAHINSPYDFNAIPIHILGSIYERFLGKVVVATDKRARVEDKPEVRKAGGVHYTPEYIARYIVENTVGKLIAGKTPGQIAEMRFADIACGSGSFLLAVFDLLLKYHGRYYNDNLNPREREIGDCVARDGKLFLSLRKKRDILINNIYGVDIDSQAVEICQLSLYLKLLEEETEASTRQHLLSFAHTAKMRKLLPDLNNNIVCGNSLIGRDILDGQLFDNGEERELNPMYFDDAFHEVMRRGGFDAIIGNPPYVRQEGLGDAKDYFRAHYKTFRATADLYVNFIEKGHSLLKKTGLFGMIVSNKWLRAAYGRPLRDFLAGDGSILQILDLAGLPVFANATVRTIILITSPVAKQRESLRYLAPLTLDDFRTVHSGDDLQRFFDEKAVDIQYSQLSAQGWCFSNMGSHKIIEAMRRRSMSLIEYAGKPRRGIISGLNEAFIIDDETRKRLVARDKKSAKIIKPILVGRDVRRYGVAFQNRYVILTRIGVPIERYPAVLEHLRQFQPALQKRWDQGKHWWELRACDYYDKFEQPKIITPDIATTCRFALDREGFLSTNTTYFIPGEDLYLLGLLNSRLAQFYFSAICAGLEGGGTTYLRFFGQYLQMFPVSKIDPQDRDHKTRHDELVAKVEAILEAKKQLAKAQAHTDKAYYEKKCASLDGEIDRLIYDLYGLTEDEIAIVERACPANTGKK